MKSLGWMIVLFLCGSFALIQNAAAGDSPEAVTKSLYRSAFDHLGFTPDAVKSKREWLTPDLYAKLWKKVNQPVPKGDAPDIEADVFFNSQEQATKFEVGKSSIDGSKAKVDVNLSWSAEKRHYLVLLKQINGAWKVYDVNYGKDGMLTDLLK